LSWVRTSRRSKTGVPMYVLPVRGEAGFDNVFDMLTNEHLGRRVVRCTLVVGYKSKQLDTQQELLLTFAVEMETPPWFPRANIYRGLDCIPSPALRVRIIFSLANP